MLDELGLVHCRYINHNGHLIFRKLCKEALCAVSMDDYSCPILLPFLTFMIFSRCMTSWNTTRINTINRESCGALTVE